MFGAVTGTCDYLLVGVRYLLFLRGGMSLYFLNDDNDHFVDICALLDGFSSENCIIY